VFDPSVLSLMDKVSFEVHPDYEKLVTGHAASRPARLEVRARGKSFVGESRYPKGSPSPDPTTTMTNEELVAKFARNAEGVIAASKVDQAITHLIELEKVEDFATVMRLLTN
jgi:2-methylcitrate dehydratase PrpD